MSIAPPARLAGPPARLEDQTPDVWPNEGRAPGAGFNSIEQERKTSSRIV